jgi:hypothetical protein
MINEILVTININTNDIQVLNLDSIDAYNNNLVVSVNSIVDGSNSYVEFNGFKFGFFIRDMDDKIVQFSTYPKAGDVLISSTDSILMTEPLNLNSDETYKLQIYVEDAGAFYDSNLIISVPIKSIPADNKGNFVSWSWNTDSKEWEPPVKMPANPKDGSGFYKWSELDQVWKLCQIINV